VTALILAHQGGWDELLLVGAPVAVIALLLVIADKRARRALERQSAAANSAEPPRGPGAESP